MTAHEPSRLVIDGRFLNQDVTGVQRVAIEICRALDRLVGRGELHDLEIEIVVPRMSSPNSDVSFRNLSVVPFGWTRGHLWEQIELDRFAGSSILLCLGNLAPAGRLLRGRRTAVMIHDLSFRYFPSAYSASFRAAYETITPLIFRRAQAVFTVSESERAAILQDYGLLVRSERLFVAANGSVACDETLDGPPPSRAERRKSVLYVGSLTRRKNMTRLLQACVELASARQDITFTFVGATPDNLKGGEIELPEAVRDRFQFLGQVNDQRKVAEQYRTASVLLFPSLYESSGLPTTEAMSYGCPVVCSDIAALRERCAEAAEYFDPTEVASIVRSVSRVLDDETRWLELQARGRLRAAQFTWEAQALALIGHLRPLVAQPPTGAREGAR